MADRKINLNSSWLTHLSDQFELQYMQDLSLFLRSEKTNGKVIYPKENQVFNALNTTPLEKVKVVILGQDPYHGPGQAHGLSFSVPVGVPIPPSLRNIYKELRSDIGITIPNHGNLQGWADQGVLLLNSVLTVEVGNAGSHQKKGWEQFTDQVVSVINERADPCVFMLWGAYAHRKGSVINEQRHLVLKAVHPSPLSAHRGFLGCAHFSKANDWLVEHGRGEINWQV